MRTKESIDRSYKVIGKIFREMREEKGISQEALVQNLMTQRSLSNFELQGEVPCWLILRVLLQRLGKNADYFVTMLSKQEYEYFAWREKVMQAIANGTVSDKEWQCDMAKDRTIHEVLQAQFVEFWEGYCNKNVEQMNKAIALTITGYPQELPMDICISTEEITYILLCMEIAFMQSKGEENYLRALLNYMENKWQEDERVKVYGKAVCLFGAYAENAQPYEKLWYYEKAIELCRRMNRLSSLAELIHRYLKEAERLGAQVNEDYKNGVYALDKIKQIFKIEERDFMLGQIQQEFYLLNEVLQNYRMERNLSVNEIGSIVCSEKTYRALEKGKRNANKTTYDAIADFMDIPFGTYSTGIVTDKYSDLRLVTQIQAMQRIHDSEGEEWFLKELEESLGERTEIPQNKQFISSVRGITLFSEKRIEPEDYIRRVEEEIRLTIPEWEVNYKEHFYTKMEMLLVFYLASAYEKLEKADIALSLLGELWEKIETSQVEKTHRANEALIVLIGLKETFSNAGHYEEAKAKILEGLQLCFDCNRGDKLDVFVFEQGWILEQEGRMVEECTEYFRWAFYVSRLFYRMIIPEQIKGYCDRHGYIL